MEIITRCNMCRYGIKILETYVRMSLISMVIDKAEREGEGKREREKGGEWKRKGKHDILNPIIDYYTTSISHEFLQIIPDLS